MCRGRTFRRRRKKANKNKEILPDMVVFQNLLKWMKTNGYKNSNLRPKVFENIGRGLMSKQPINCGDLIISIPQKLLITPHVVLDSYLGSYFEKYQKTATGDQILSVFLMCEKLKDQSSYWKPYIDSLPISYNIPAFYGHDCLDFVPRILYKTALLQVQNMEISFKELGNLLEILEEAFPFFHGLLDLDLFKWAWCTVNTRCIYLDCIDTHKCENEACTYHLSLVPFLDLLNHSFEVQVETKFNKETNHFEIKSLYCAKKYSQAFISYGSHSNTTLLLEYGFVIPENNNDTVSFSFDEILFVYKACRISSHYLEEKIRFISRNNLIRNLVCSSEGLSWNLNIILIILTSNQNIQCCKWKPYMDSAMIPRNEEQYNILKKSILLAKLEELENQTDHKKHSVYSDFQKQISLLMSSLISIVNKALS